MDVLEPLDEVTQDFGIRWAWNFQNKGDVHASFNRNLYNDRIDSLVVDNPFRATDLAYVSTAVPGGPAQARFSTSPDNEATRGAFGAQFKFARQTRITADLAFGTWTQNAAFLPYTINSAIFTPAGAPANAVTTLQQPSLDGKIDTTSYNFTFGSRPIERPRRPAALSQLLVQGQDGPLGDHRRHVRLSRSELDRRQRADGGRALRPRDREPDRLQHGHFEAQVELRHRRPDARGRVPQRADLVGGARELVRHGRLGERLHARGHLPHATTGCGFRFHFDHVEAHGERHRGGSVAALQGVMADHAERDQTRVGADIELTPSDKYGVTFAYNRRNDDYPNRPFEGRGEPRDRERSAQGELRHVLGGFRLHAERARATHGLLHL